MTDDAKSDELVDAFRPGPEKSGIRYIPQRLFVLVIALVLFNGWLVSQFGLNILVVLGIESALPLLKSLRSALKPGDEDVVKKFISTFLYTFLDGRVIAVLCTVLVIAMSFVSVVVVMADGVPALGKIKLTANDSFHSSVRDLRGPTSVVRFPRFTTPFGRPFYLEAPDYRRYSFTLYPFAPKLIRVSSDLALAPSILIRIPYPHSDIEGGQIRIVDSKGNVFALANTSGRIASMLIGRAVPVPDPFIEGWRHELQAHRPPPDKSSEFEAIARWRPDPAAPQVPVPPNGSALTAQFQRKIQLNTPNVAADATFVVGSAAFQDIALKRRKQ